MRLALGCVSGVFENELPCMLVETYGIDENKDSGKPDPGWSEQALFHRRTTPYCRTSTISSIIGTNALTRVPYAEILHVHLIVHKYSM